MCRDGQRNWLSQRLSAAARGEQRDLVELFSAAGRRLGNELVRGGDPSEFAHWRTQDLARVAGLLSHIPNLAIDDHAALLADLFFRGSSEEKRAVLFALPLLSQAERHLELAVEACRTNTLTVFEAIGCENVYPAVYFSEPQFNQLVLKAIFIDVDITRIIGLASRMVPSLVEDLRNYCRERQAASRAIPLGLTLILEKVP